MSPDMETPRADEGSASTEASGTRDLHSGEATSRWIEAWERRAPWLILGYVVALALLRLWLSPYLEVDEAHFVGQTDLRLTYPNSHPPLYNWLIRAALEITGWRWALAAVLVKFSLLGAFHLLSWDAARRLGGSRAGLYAIAASAFLPQVVWMSALTLAHSVLVLAGTAAVVQAAAMLAERRSAARWLWLGVAVAIGALAKYNFALFLGPFLLAIIVTPGTRWMVSDRRFLLSLLAFAVLAGPSLVAAAFEPAQATARMSKLFTEGGATAGLDLPGIGLDGVLSLLQAGLAWAGPALLIWWIARRGRRTRRGDALVEALGRAMVLSLILFALIVLAADMHRVRERYLTPMLAALPVWLAVARPVRATWVVGLAAAVYLIAWLGIAGTIGFSEHRLAYPYRALAAQISERLETEDSTVIGARHVDGANLSIALGETAGESPWPGQPLPDGRLLLVWRGEGPRPGPLQRFPEAEAPAIRVSAPLENLSGEAVVFSAEIVER